MNKLVASVFAAFGLVQCVSASAPSVSNVIVAESTDWTKLEVSYVLSGAPAIVTVDVLTNGVSIGGEHLWTLSGDVNKVVEADVAPKRVTWDVVGEWPGPKLENGIVSAVVTAWSTNAPPDYMVVDLRNDEDRGGIERIRYFTSTNFLPGGLLSTNYYRTEAIVLRRIHAANRHFTAGESPWESGYNSSWGKFDAVLPNDYYIGVFPVTQAQWALVQSNAGKTSDSDLWPSGFSNPAYRDMRPVEKVSRNDIRNTDWPSSPDANSFLGRMRSQTGVAFDLPGDVQWEFACKGDVLDGFWNDGSPMSKAGAESAFATCVNLPGRYSGNVGGDSSNANCDADSGTAIVGSYSPSTWGLYDMHGNVMEWTLDRRYDNAATRKTLRGAINVSSSDSRYVLHGGCYNRVAYQAVRSHINTEWRNSRYDVIGFRVVVNLP